MDYPMEEVMSMAKKWRETIDNWSDDYFTFELLNNKKATHDLASDNNKEKLNDYLMTRIKGAITSTFDHIIHRYEQLINDNDKINFLHGIFDTSEDLIKIFEGNKSDAVYDRFAINCMKELNWKLHNNFDDIHFVLLNKNRHIDDKMKLRFNISRSQLIHLLILLKDSNIIDNTHSDYAIATFATKFFISLNDHTKEHSTLLRVKDYIRDIRSYEQYSESAVKEIKTKILNSEIKFKE